MDEDIKIGNKLEIDWIEYLSNLEYDPTKEELPKIFHSWTSGYILKGEEDIELLNMLKDKLNEQDKMIDKLNTVIGIQAFGLEEAKKQNRKLSKK